uniref:HECT-type E3 ubiquitin transferase n=1 Tax=Globisporangium ultimum (strain ATCC 200006 / CBS 805.95 / DAOM BR144) TaxID=431595 RepID=K3X465_GLOUD
MHSTPPTNTERHRRARVRKEWQRRRDVNGELFWYRDAGTTDTSYPGYVISFADDKRGFADAECPDEHVVDNESFDVDVVVTTEQPLDVIDTPTLLTDELDPSVFQSLSPTDPHDEVRRRKTSKIQGVTPEARRTELEEIAASLHFELLNANGANPAQLPLVSASDPSLFWDNILHLVSQVFTTKYAHFVTTTAALATTAEGNQIKLRIDRDQLLEESMESLGVFPVEVVRAPLQIHFIDEAGVDAGGLQREWFVLLNEQLADPANGIFQCVNKTEHTFYLNPNSRHGIGEDHLVYYFAAGRLLGRALLEGQVLGFHLHCRFSRLSWASPLTDLKYFDPEIYKSMKWIRENNGVDALDLDFTVTDRRGEDVVAIDLIPNGANIEVTDDNKEE